MFYMGEQTKDEINDKILHCMFAEINNDPRTFQKRMASADRVDWIKAILEKLRSKFKNKVWTLVDRPEFKTSGKRPNIIDSKWVF